MQKPSKDFDCVEMKRQIQEAVYEKAKDFNYLEYIEYIRAR